jgi:hypothetical protein
MLCQAAPAPIGGYTRAGADWRLITERHPIPGLVSRVSPIRRGQVRCYTGPHLAPDLPIMSVKSCHLVIRPIVLTGKRSVTDEGTGGRCRRVVLDPRWRTDHHRQEVGAYCCAFLLPGGLLDARANLAQETGCPGVGNRLGTKRRRFKSGHPAHEERRQDPFGRVLTAFRSLLHRSVHHCPDLAAAALPAQRGPGWLAGHQMVVMAGRTLGSCR